MANFKAKHPERIAIFDIVTPMLTSSKAIHNCHQKSKRLVTWKNDVPVICPSAIGQSNIAYRVVYNNTLQAEVDAILVNIQQAIGAQYVVTHTPFTDCGSPTYAEFNLTIVKKV